MNVIQSIAHAGSGQAGGEGELRGRSSVEGEALVMIGRVWRMSCTTMCKSVVIGMRGN